MLTFFFLFCREIWPNSSFGENDIDPEEEFMCFYEIFRMDVPGLS
jgi:hypothetical protein